MAFPQADKRRTQTDTRLMAPGAAKAGGNSKNAVVPATERSGNAFLIELSWELLEGRQGLAQSGQKDDIGDCSETPRLCL